MLMILVFYGALISSNPLKYVSMNYQECRVIPAMVNINNNEPLFHLYRILVNKRSGSCNDFNNRYGKLCVPDVVKGMNIKVFNLVSRTKETH